MNVGDYVRFKDKRGNTYIRKVIDGYKAHWYGCKVDKEANNVPYVSAKNIIKSSPNIIDLIEVGDYVNGYKVTYVANVEPCPSGKFVDIDCDKDSSDSYFFDNEIKTIVTKEQFESMEYKLGE